MELERDGLITDERGVTLTIFTADCTPILFYDPIRQAVGAAHAGWRGTAAGIAARTVTAMVQEFGCHPDHIRAAIGPCIGPCCFETDEDVPAAMVAALGSEAEHAISGHGPKYHVDLKELNRIWLRRAGRPADCGLPRLHRLPAGSILVPPGHLGDRGSLAALIQLP